MNFLSEAALDHPDAISFASGRPSADYFDLDGWLASIPDFQRYLASGVAKSDFENIGRTLAQYGRAGGLINDLISAQLATDHHVFCRPEHIIVTNGCQEALALCLQALCSEPGDIVLSRNPTYIGATGAADFAGIPILPIHEHGDEDFATSLQRTISEFVLQGKKPRALYLIPDFDNPTGIVMSLADRLATIAVCQKHQVVILEDNPYGMFRFEGSAPPLFATLDDYSSVVYLGTYSKTICPAVRVGFAALPDKLFGSVIASRALKTELGERRSFLTVNTSQLNQAMVGGILLKEGGSLQRLVQPSLEHYRRNRNAMVEALFATLGTNRSVSWNRPEGGFFLSVHFPFTFDREDMLDCATRFHVLAMPMTFFSLDGTQRDCARLSFSNVNVREIEIGIERFSRYVDQRLWAA